MPYYFVWTGVEDLLFLYLSEFAENVQLSSRKAWELLMLRCISTNGSIVLIVDRFMQTQGLQRMNITLCLTALHIVQSGTILLPFSGDQPLPCLLSSLYMTTGSLPSFCMNVLHRGTQV